MSAYTMSQVFAVAEREYQEQVMQNTWGHLVTWNRNTASWWLTPIKLLKEPEPNDWMMIGWNNQRLGKELGNGYFRRDDLIIVGNKTDNPDLIPQDAFIA